MNTTAPSYLLNNIGAELLNRKCADIADELTNDCIAKPVVIEVENVLDNLTERTHQVGILSSWTRMTHIIAIRILNKSQCIVCDLIHELDALMIGGVINTPLEHTTTVAMSSNLNAVRRYRIVYELEANLGV